LPNINKDEYDPTLTWSTTGSPTVFKTMCSAQAVSKWLCVTFVDYDVKLDADKATINFKSSNITPLKMSGVLFLHNTCYVMSDMNSPQPVLPTPKLVGYM
ncbi:MAG: hypothetical protein ACKPKO_23130, partial [Candidatus Fonsibacter sp.]